ncbi:DoxX family protein [Mycobacterium sp. PS03-16]|uniref:DoxX family protein n=1 Tax=Mycobacterium sp. PS03-16 TaxID=2559611 RepID=UPI001073EB45|nr:DoxX family protein [Mycobacterium sp. PS03-16]TFV57203.1 DoxX family protein [Mycobacterium sp. PS03-16]
MFRFGVVYLGLFCLVFAQLTFAYAGVLTHWLPDNAVIWQLMALEPLLGFVARHLFGVDAVLHLDSGSGDQAIIWVLVFCLLVVALIATAVWSLLDRKRPAYPRLAAWFLTFLRMCLGGQLLFYGFAKVIPTQVPAPPLSALLQPYGDLSPASVLWLQVGGSYPYEIFLGAAEVLAGVLLFWPPTATLGALLSVAAMGQVFLLNMTFDVPVKILSFHLLVISAVLVAPHARGLVDLLVRQRPSGPLRQPALFGAARANRIAAVVQVALGVWVLIGCVSVSRQAWYEYGGGRPEPELYGIWAVTEFRVDGRPTPPRTDDAARWQRVVVDQPGAVTVQQMDGTLTTVPATIDPGSRTVEMPDLAADLRYRRPDGDRLILAGRVNGRAVEIDLDAVDPNSFTLRSRGFTWVQEYPYFR